MKRLAVIAVLLAAALVGAALAHAEIAGKDGLFVSFDGGFAPRALPRDRDVPVTVNLSGKIKTANGERPPQLRRISFAVNRYGKVDTTGLPRCRADLLESTDSEAAMRRCGPSILGRGRFSADVAFPNREPLPVHGQALAFNARAQGHEAMLLHIHTSNPVEVTVVLTFIIHHPKQGKFGTVLTTKIPRLASDLGYVTDMSLVFNRKYRYRGERRSFLSARCAAPNGFPGAIFSFTKGTFTFAGGTQIVTTLTRDCVVR